MTIRVCHYGHLFNGMTNRSLRELICQLIPGYSPRHMTYDLLRRYVPVKPNSGLASADC